MAGHMQLLLDAIKEHPGIGTGELRRLHAELTNDEFNNAYWLLRNEELVYRKREGKKNAHYMREG